MPRTARASAAAYCYHALNRGNAYATVFHKDRDYEAFLEMMAEAAIRVPMRVVAYCLMPNHFHLALWPQGDGDLSRWMHWLLTTHVRRYRRHYHRGGHVWQGRFRAFPIQDDDHLRVVLRDIERNALRAGLVERAEFWPWSILSRPEQSPVLDPGPAPRGADWVASVNAPMTEAETAATRESIRRDRPLETESWVRTTAGMLGLESSLREPGRPRAGRLQVGPSNIPDRPNSHCNDERPRGCPYPRWP
jgi:putative transposase